MSHLSSSGERAKSDRSTTYESRAFESRAIASLNVDAPSSNARRMTVAAESDTATEHLRQHLLDSRRIRSMRKGSFWRSDYEYHSRFMGPAPAGSYAQNEHLVPQLVSRVAAFEHELAHNAGPTVFQDCVLLALLVSDFVERIEVLAASDLLVLLWLYAKSADFASRISSSEARKEAEIELKRSSLALAKRLRPVLHEMCQLLVSDEAEPAATAAATVVVRSFAPEVLGACQSLLALQMTAITHKEFQLQLQLAILGSLPLASSVGASGSRHTVAQGISHWRETHQRLLAHTKVRHVSVVKLYRRFAECLVLLQDRLAYSVLADLCCSVGTVATRVRAPAIFEMLTVIPPLCTIAMAEAAASAFAESLGIVTESCDSQLIASQLTTAARFYRTMASAPSVPPIDGHELDRSLVAAVFFRPLVDKVYSVTDTVFLGRVNGELRTSGDLTLMLPSISEFFTHKSRQGRILESFVRMPQELHRDMRVQRLLLGMLSSERNAATLAAILDRLVPTLEGSAPVEAFAMALVGLMGSSATLRPNVLLDFLRLPLSCPNFSLHFDCLSDAQVEALAARLPPIAIDATEPLLDMLREEEFKANSWQRPLFLLTQRAVAEALARQLLSSEAAAASQPPPPPPSSSSSASQQQLAKDRRRSTYKTQQNSGLKRLLGGRQRGAVYSQLPQLDAELPDDQDDNDLLDDDDSTESRARLPQSSFASSSSSIFTSSSTMAVRIQAIANLCDWLPTIASASNLRASSPYLTSPSMFMCQFFLAAIRHANEAAAQLVLQPPSALLHLLLLRQPSDFPSQETREVFAQYMQQRQLLAGAFQHLLESIENRTLSSSDLRLACDSADAIAVCTTEFELQSPESQNVSLILEAAHSELQVLEQILVTNAAIRRWVLDKFDIPANEFLPTLPNSPGSLSLTELHEAMRCFPEALDLEPNTMRVLSFFLPRNSALFHAAIKYSMRDKREHTLDDVDAVVEQSAEHLQQLLDTELTLGKLEELRELLVGLNWQMVDSELALVAEFFNDHQQQQQHSSDAAPLKPQTHMRVVMDALALLAYRNNLGVLATCFETYQVHDTTVTAYMERLERSSDIRLSQARELLHQVRRDLQGIEADKLVYFSMATDSKELITFLAKQHDFDATANLLAGQLQGYPFGLDLLNNTIDIRRFFAPLVDMVREQRLGTTPLPELCRQVHLVVGHLSDDELQRKQLNLSSIKLNMQDLRMWFTGSGMSLDTILPFVDRLLRSGYFESRLTRHELGAQLTLCFNELRHSFEGVSAHEVAHALPPANMLDLLRAITIFVDNKDIEATKQQQLRDFVESFEHARMTHDTRLALEAAGHPLFQGTLERLNSGNADLSAATLLQGLEALGEQLSRWTIELAASSKRQPRLLLLDNNQLAQFLLAVSRLSPNQPAAKLYQALVPYVSCCFPDVVDLVRVLADTRATRTAPPTVGQIVRAYTRAHTAALPRDEFDSIAHLRLVENLLVRITNVYLNDRGARLWSSGGDEIPSVVTAFDFDGVDLHRLLVSLFEGVPHPSQLLVCSESTSASAVTSFVARAQTFSSQPFAVVGVNRLSFAARQELQAITTKVYLRSESKNDEDFDDDDPDELDPSSRRCHLLLIFTDRVAVEMFSFLHVQERTVAQLPAPEQLQAYTRSTQCLEARSIRELHYWVGEPCSGKSFFINKRIQELAPPPPPPARNDANDPSATDNNGDEERSLEGNNVLRLTLNEDWTVSLFIRRVKALLESLPSTRPEIVVYMNISPYAPLHTVAQFFFSLLMWGYVYDAVTGEMLHTLDLLRLEQPDEAAPPQQPPTWYWLVELSAAPPNDRLYGRLSSPETIIRSLPALLMLGTRVNCNDAVGDSLVISIDEYLCAAFWDLFTKHRLFSEDGYEALLLAGRRAFGKQSSEPLLTEAQVRSKLANLLAARHPLIPPLNANRSMFFRLLGDRLRWLYLYSLRYHLHRDEIAQMKQASGFSLCTPAEVFERFVAEAAALSGSNIRWSSATPPSFSARSRAESAQLLPVVTFFDFSPQVPDEHAPIDTTSGLKKVTLTLQKATKKPARLRTELARGLGILRSERMVRIITQQRYVLTPDFALKLLVLNERRRSGMSVILSGDTGTGKTEMLNLFAVIINSDSELVPDILELVHEWLESLLNLEPAVRQLPDFRRHVNKTAADLCHNLRLFAEFVPPPAASAAAAAAQATEDPSNFEIAARSLVHFVRRLQDRYPLIVCSPTMLRAITVGQGERILHRAVGDGGEPAEGSGCAIQTLAQLMQLMNEVLSVRFQELFHRLLMHQRFTAQELKRRMGEIVAQATQLEGYRQHLINRTRADIGAVKVVVFIDEFNTTSVMGLIKEMLVDHTLDGVRLPESLFFAAAMNPAITTALDPEVLQAQQRIVNQTGIAGDMTMFAVRPPHPSMERLVFDFADLTHEQERSFVNALLQELEIELGSAEERRTLATFIHMAHDFVRECHIFRMRVSIRDIMRAVQLFRYFRHSAAGRAVAYLAFDGVESVQQQQADKRVYSNLYWSSLILSLGMAYFLRLPVKVGARRMRDEFANAMRTALTATESCYYSFRDFHAVLAATLRRFYDETDIPVGIAPTAALMENLFATVICIDAKIPVMICGPAGCSKTLSFTIAVDNMKGPASKRPLYQRLHHLHPFRYQCSEQSTDTEIEAVYDSAIKRQLMFEGSDDPGRCTERSAVLLDEAGLPSEDTMPLKVIHYKMDHPQVATVILTNKLLDAAKTNRTLQVMQSEPSGEDLRALTQGCLYPQVAQYMTEQQRAIVDGLCSAFASVKDNRMFAKPNGEDMFHLRDFIYFLRYLRRFSQLIDDQSFELTGPMLLRALQRNFNGIAAEPFETLVQVFFASMNAQPHAPNIELPSNSPVVSNIAPLRESLNDRLQDGENPNMAAFRYVMVLDPTDTESSVSLLFSLNLLDQAHTRIICLGNFAEDETDTARSNLVLQIKTAMELGETVIMINAQSVFSSFYDVFNRHFTMHAISTDDDDVKQRQQFRYYANVAVGSFSRPCVVHPDFRVIVHVPQSALAVTPSPLLSRFEKYTLSISDCLQERLERKIYCDRWPVAGVANESGAIKIIQASCEHMVERLHREHQQNRLLYGLVPRETVASLMLRVLDINEWNAGALPVVPPAFHVKPHKALDEEDDENEEEPTSTSNNVVVVAVPTSALQPTNLKALIRQANFHLLQLARPESVFFTRQLLLGSYVQEYLLHQEHFNLLRFLHHLIRAHLDADYTQPHMVNKWVTFIRSSGDLLRLPDGDLQRFLVQPLPGILATSDIRTVVLSNVVSSQHCEALVNSFVASACRVFLGIVDVRQCKSSQINFLRNKIDLALERECRQRGVSRSTRLVVLILHIPPEMAFRSSAPYHAIYLNEWDFVYVDSLGVSSAAAAAATPAPVAPVGGNVANVDLSDIDETHKMFEADSRTWIAKAFGLESTEIDGQSVQDAFASVFHELLTSSIEQMLASNQPLQLSPLVYTNQFYRQLGAKQQRVAEMTRVIKANPYLTEQLLERFGQTWSSSLLNAVMHESCASLQRGEVVGSILHVVRNALRFLLAPMVVQIVRTLVSNYNLEPIVEIERLLAESQAKAAEEPKLSRRQRKQLAQHRPGEALQTLVRQVLRLIEPPPIREVLTRTAIDRVIPSFDYALAPCLPMYDVIAEQLFSLAAKARSLLHHGSRGPHEILHALTQLVADERSGALADVLATISSTPELMQRFQRDFLQRSLKLPNLQSPWLELCMNALQLLADKYGTGVLRFVVIKMFHLPELSYFSMCLLPLQQLRPPPSVERVCQPSSSSSTSSIGTKHRVDSFVVSLTLRLLWCRLEAILRGELGTEELVNWCHVMRSLRSRLPPHPELIKILRREPQQLVQLESMSCLMLFLQHVELQLPHKSTLTMLRMASLRDSLLLDHRPRGLEQAIRLCHRLFRGYLCIAEANRERKRILIEETVWYFLTDNKHSAELPPELLSDLKYLLELAAECDLYRRFGARVREEILCVQDTDTGGDAGDRPLLAPEWFLRTLDAWLHKKPVGWEHAVMELLSTMIATWIWEHSDETVFRYSFVPNLLERGDFLGGSTNHLLIEAMTFELLLRRLETEGGLSLQQVAQQYDAIHPNDDAVSDPARVLLTIRKAALGTYFLQLLAREIEGMQADSLADDLRQCLERATPARAVVRQVLGFDGEQAFTAEARLYFIQQLQPSSRLLELVKSPLCLEQLYLTEYSVASQDSEQEEVGLPSYHMFPFMMAGIEQTRRKSDARAQRMAELYKQFRHLVRSKDAAGVRAFVDETVARGEWERLALRMLVVLVVYYDYFTRCEPCTVLARLLGQTRHPGPLSERLQFEPVELAAVLFFVQGPKDVSDEDAILDPIDGLWSRQLHQGTHDRSLAHLSANCLAVALGTPRNTNHLYNRILNPRALDRTYGPGSSYNNENRDCGYKFDPDLTPSNNMGGIRRYRLAINALVWIPLSLCLAVNPVAGQDACRNNYSFLNYVNEDGAAVNRNRSTDQKNKAYVLNRAGTFYYAFVQDDELRAQQIEPMHFLTEALYRLWLLCNKEQRSESFREMYSSQAEAVAYERIVQTKVFEHVSKNYAELKRSYERQARNTQIEALLDMRSVAALRLASPLVPYPLFEEMKARVLAPLLESADADDDDDDDNDDDERAGAPAAIDKAGAKFLNAFLEQRSRLRSLEHVPTLVAFYQLLNQVFACRLTREQAFSLSVPAAIEYLHFLNEAISTIEQLKRAWESFQLTWQQLLDTQLAGCGQFVMPEINDQTLFAQLVTTDQSSYGLVLDMVNTLIIKQNEILQCREAASRWNTYQLLYEDRHPSGKSICVEWLPFDSDHKLLLTGDSDESEFELYALMTMKCNAGARASVSFDYRRVLRHVLNRYTCGRFLFAEVASASILFPFRQTLEEPAPSASSSSSTSFEPIVQAVEASPARQSAVLSGRDLVAQYTGINALRLAVASMPADLGRADKLSFWRLKLGDLDEPAVRCLSEVFCGVIRNLAAAHAAGAAPKNTVIKPLLPPIPNNAVAARLYQILAPTPIKYIRSGAEFLLAYHDNREYLFVDNQYLRFNVALPDKCYVLDLVQMLRNGTASDLEPRVVELVELLSEYFSAPLRLLAIQALDVVVPLAHAFRGELEALHVTQREIEQLVPSSVQVKMFRRYLVALHALNAELRLHHSRKFARSATDYTESSSKYTEWLPTEVLSHGAFDHVVPIAEPTALEEHFVPREAPAALVRWQSDFEPTAALDDDDDESPASDEVVVSAVPSSSSSSSSSPSTIEDA